MASGGIAHERRRQKRDLTTVPMSFVAGSGAANTKKGEALNGITLNVSDSGICFYTQTCLEESTPATITSKAIWEQPRPGTIMWCRKITEELYRVGVKLAD